MVGSDEQHRNDTARDKKYKLIRESSFGSEVTATSSGSHLLENFVCRALPISPTAIVINSESILKHLDPKKLYVGFDKKTGEKLYRPAVKLSK